MYFVQYISDISQCSFHILIFYQTIELIYRYITNKKNDLERHHDIREKGLKIKSFIDVLVIYIRVTFPQKKINRKWYILSIPCLTRSNTLLKCFISLKIFSKFVKQFTYKNRILLFPTEKYPLFKKGSIDISKNHQIINKGLLL